MERVIYLIGGTFLTNVFKWNTLTAFHGLVETVLCIRTETSAEGPEWLRDSNKEYGRKAAGFSPAQHNACMSGLRDFLAEARLLEVCLSDHA
jgi:hypothetical protein